MKTKPSSLFVIIFLGLIFAVLLAFYFRRDSLQYFAHQQLGGIVYSNANEDTAIVSESYLTNKATINLAVVSNLNLPVLVTNNSSINSDTNKPIELFKVIIDQETGQYASVASDRISVSLKEKDGKIIWSQNMFITKTGSNIRPEFAELFGDGKVDGISLHNGRIWVRAGGSYWEMDRKTGNPTMLGSD